MRPDHQCDQDQNQSLHDHTFMEKKKNLPALEPGFAALLKIHPVLAPRCNQYGLIVTVMTVFMVTMTVILMTVTAIMMTMTILTILMLMAMMTMRH